ncbi:DUF1329 domain-containing protein [Endozoicomonas sp. OPT23]|uniref:DUF1329 domain-containing protein n=1 Tax=Endozoicomonas sp. OPT23 TaxID=2072845 RepID=UPI00129B3BBC|nr:DUF1329 domain-containing protein [Endozoicomonas sp. OPT23]MRI33836.1 DUF1329 domain-containing protein [Endozoicomonas sp. OPT23]
MKRVVKHTLAATIAATMISATVQAKVSPEEASRLGRDLSPQGATIAGNKEGTIPAWNPDFKYPERGANGQFVDPYADEKPLFSITAANVDQHKNRLSAGQIKMFKTYPDTYRMDIYPSHRNGGYSDFINKNTIANATRATLAKDGAGVVNAFGGAPFPIPKQGEEVVWNMNQAAFPHFWQEAKDAILIYKNGSQLVGQQLMTFRAPYFNPNSSIEEFQKEKHPKIMVLNQTMEPARSKGESVLVHEPLDFSEVERAAWTYTPGVRKVRRAPNVKYDIPTNLGNFTPSDTAGAFTGSTIKFNWKLLGKRELYIPYNTNRFEDPALEYDELFPKHHANPDYLRYELHRVWVVEANLKEGERNTYKKRVLHVDEDGWIPAVTDLYDNNDELKRLVLVNSLYRTDLPGVMLRSQLHMDMKSNEYIALELMNKTQLTNPALNDGVKSLSWFKPRTLRRLGVR